jgi:Uma2 family endonuclease
MAIEVTPRRFSASEYFQMIDAGVFAPGERLELVDGAIVQMSPIGDAHAACVRRLNRLLGQALGEAAIVDVQSPLRVADTYVSEPDLALLRARSDYYSSATPTPADCLLVIEVADTTLTYDREIKLPRYALGGVPDVWLVDIEHQQVVAYSRASGDIYQGIEVFVRRDVVRLEALGLNVGVDAIL